MRTAACPLSLERLDGMLAADEVARARCFRRDIDSTRFRNSHAALRAILGSLLGQPPETLVFGRSEWGKPYLISPSRSSLEFSLSHSADIALIGVSERGPIGVDIEAGPPPLDPLTLSRHFFASEECAWIARLPVSEQARRFLEVWTRKEAYLKAIGLGLLGDPMKCRCELGSSGQVSADLQPSDGHSWIAIGLEGIGAAAAVVGDARLAAEDLAPRAFDWGVLKENARV